jgi:ribosomal protein L10
VAWHISTAKVINMYPNRNIKRKKKIIDTVKMLIEESPFVIMVKG